MSALTIKIGSGSTPTGGSAVYSDSGIKFIRSQNVYDGGLILDNVAYISEEINRKKAGSIVRSKDILLNITGGSIGRCALVPDEFDTANVNQHVMIIRLVELELRNYIHSIIISPYIQNKIFSRQVGSGRGGLSAETLSTFLIPIPPAREQHAIQGELNHFLTYISEIEMRKTDISNLITLTKTKILDLAIHGKLLPQDPNDEPASVLLERIRAEKEELIKQGKIKRDKKESVIFKGDDNSYYEKSSNNDIEYIDDEIPFEIPNGWEWARLETVAEYKKGPFGSSITKSMFVPDSSTAIKVYEQKNAIGKDVNAGNYFISTEKYETLKNFEVFPNDIIVSCAGTIGETFVLPTSMRKGIINQALMKIMLYDLDFLDFYLLYFDFVLKETANNQGYGMALKNIPPFSILKKYFITIPPKNEQVRILEQVKVLFTELDTIADSLS